MTINKSKYLIGLTSSYDKDLGFNTEEIKALIPKILDDLFNIKEIKELSCLFGQKYKTISLDIVFVDDTEIQKINSEYRNKDKPTDVITFALFADDDFKIVVENDIYLGEILISVDTAKKQAQKDIIKEILTLITHGILHLLGFDHTTDEDYNFIVNIQNQIIQNLLES